MEPLEVLRNQFIDVGSLIGLLFWIILFLVLFSPSLQFHSLKSARMKLISLIERKYGLG